MNTEDVEFLIRDYFLSKSSDHPGRCTATAATVTTVANVMLVLDWGSDGTIKESWDSAIALLSEVGEVLIEAPDSRELKQWKKRGLNLKWEKMMAILVVGLSRSNKIPPHKRLKAVLQLLPEFERCHTRSVKSAVIDAVLDLVGQIDPDIMTNFLVVLMSKWETTRSFQQYFEEVIEDFKILLTDPPRHEPPAGDRTAAVLGHASKDREVFYLDKRND